MGSTARLMPVSMIAFVSSIHRSSSKEGTRTGGIQRSRKTNVLPTDSAKKELRKATEVCELVSETIHQVRVGAIDPRIAKFVGGRIWPVPKEIQETQRNREAGDVAG